MPLHAGHLFLCETASKMVDHLTVLVCTRECEPIEGKLRFSWMKNSVPDNVSVLHYDKDVPQEPSDHPNFWEIWRGLIRKVHHEPIDMVFGSEPYIFRLAQELDSIPVLIDPEREIYSVSATAIRENVQKNWRYVPQVVRPYYQRKVCVLGPESSGKSTLVKHLADNFGTTYVPE